MSTEAKPASPGLLKGWLKMFAGSMGGVAIGALMMYANPWIDKAIKPEKPLANFGVEHNGLTVTFRNLSLGGSEGRWDFGDSSPIQIVPANAETVTHTYRKAGVYTAKLALRNLIDEVNERSVTVEVVDPNKPALAGTSQPSAPEFRPAIVDFYVKHSGKPGEPVYAPATFQFQATADNGEMFIWDFGDGKGIQMGDAQAVHTFKRAGAYPVKLIVLNKKNERSVKEVVVQVAEPPVGMVAVNLRVTDHAMQSETLVREVPVSGAATLNGVKAVTNIEQTVTASPSCEIVAVEKIAGQNQNLESVHVTIAADKKSVRIVGKPAKVQGTQRAILFETYSIREVRREKVAREPVPVMASVPAPGNTTVRLPSLPPEWTDVKREFAFELVQGNQVIWSGKDLPNNVPVQLHGRTYTLVATRAGEKVEVNLLGRN